MRKKLLFFVPILLLLSCSDDLKLNVISLNVRYDNPADSVNAWPMRRDQVVDFIIDEHPDIFGLQEVLWHQYEYIDSLLPGYKSVAAGRNDGRESGEMTPLFFNLKRFELRDYDTFWLSETPDKPGSKGWGAVLPRIVTWARLFDNFTGDDFYFFNTHFSHMSDSARLMSAGILSSQVDLIARDKNFIICGDFNMGPDSKAFSQLLYGDSNKINDSFDISQTEPRGPLGTFNGFADRVGSDRIDYIFVSDGTVVYSHETLEIKKDSVYISDHWPVKVSLLLK